MYIILVAVMLFMLMGLIVLVIGLGAIGTNKTRLQNAANSGALSALEAYINSADPVYQTRADAALLRTNQILSLNKMPGTADPLGDLDLANSGGAEEGGFLEFGMWYAKDPDPSTPTTPCGGVFPCFEPDHNYSQSPPPNINAARVFVKNQSANPLVIKLAGLIGRSNFFLSSNSTAALAPRCVAYLMDVSGSSKYETHPPGTTITLNPCNFPGDPPSCSSPQCDSQCNPNDCSQCINWQWNPAKYFPNDSQHPDHIGHAAFRQSSILPSGVPVDCTDPDAYSNSEVWAWCNYERDPRGGVIPTFPFRHNHWDYDIASAAETSPFGPVYIDKLWIPGVYEGPQPLVRNFLAFNAGLRFVDATQSPGDLSVVMAFTSDIRDRFPDPAQQGYELTNDLGFLIQLTNVENRGVTDATHSPIAGMPEIHPNFVDRGWFPISGDSSTNLVKSIYVAAQALHSECLPTARKAIVLATDGVSTCSVTNDSNPLPVCGKTWPNYLTAENQLLNTDIYGGPPHIPFIRQLLTDWEIAFTALLDSAGVRPNFYNIRTNASGCVYPSGPGAQPTDPKCFLSYEQARAQGFGGIGDPLSFFDYSFDVPSQYGTNTEENAYLYFGQPGVIFGRPMGVLGKMAIMTGGFMCGLLPTAPVGAYVDFYNDRNGAGCDQPCDTLHYKCSPCVLDGASGYRTPTCEPTGGIPCSLTNAQVWAPEYLSKSEQAARCAQMTVGLNPFTLVARDTDL